MSRSYHKSATHWYKYTPQGLCRMKFSENVLDINRNWKQELPKEVRKELKRVLSIAVKMPYYTSFENKQMRKATRRKNKKITEEFQFQKVTIV